MIYKNPTTWEIARFDWMYWIAMIHWFTKDRWNLDYHGITTKQRIVRVKEPHYYKCLDTIISLWFTKKIDE